MVELGIIYLCVSLILLFTFFSLQMDNINERTNAVFGFIAIFIFFVSSVTLLALSSSITRSCRDEAILHYMKGCYQVDTLAVDKNGRVYDIVVKEISSPLE